MSIYSLYIKTHKTTGLKYLGRTIKDPFLYKGSGKHWIRHLKKHGNSIHTEILGKYDNIDDLRRAGLFFSEKFDIVKSKHFANIIAESGEGWHGPRGTPSERTRKKLVNSWKTRKKFHNPGNTKTQRKNVPHSNTVLLNLEKGNWAVNSDHGRNWHIDSLKKLNKKKRF